MTLAQVVYQMSTDTDFASQLYSNPKETLAKRGLKISNEELAFLLTARNRVEQDKLDIVSLSDVGNGSWRA
jgi:hypothetical protein